MSTAVSGTSIIDTFVISNWGINYTEQRTYNWIKWKSRQNKLFRTWSYSTTSYLVLLSGCLVSELSLTGEHLHFAIALYNMMTAIGLCSLIYTPPFFERVSTIWSGIHLIAILESPSFCFLNHERHAHIIGDMSVYTSYTDFLLTIKQPYIYMTTLSGIPLLSSITRFHRKGNVSRKLN